MFWGYTSNNIKTVIIFLFENETQMKKHLIEEHVL